METKQQFIDRKWDQYESVYMNIPRETLINGIPLRISTGWVRFWNMVKVNKEIK